MRILKWKEECPSVVHRISLQSRWWEWPTYPKLHVYLRIVNPFFWRREWQPILVFLPGEFHEQRNLVGYCPWGHKRVGHDWGLTLIYSFFLLKKFKSVLIHDVVDNLSTLIFRIDSIRDVDKWYLRNWMLEKGQLIFHGVKLCSREDTGILKSTHVFISWSHNPNR